MTYEELFDAYREVVSQKRMLAAVGDDLWNQLENCRDYWESMLKGAGMAADSDVMGFDSRPDTYHHIGRVRAYLTGVIKELLNRAQGHDASKLVDPELETFNEYTPKLRHSTYGSDEYKGFLKGMGEGLAHHYAENRHHPEHHADGIEGMTLIDLVEMICDWRAATERHADGDIRRSIEQNQERFGYGDQLKRILHNTVDAMEA